MKIKLISFLLLMFSVFGLMAQTVNQKDASGKKQGKWVKKDEHGVMLYEGNFKDDKPVGEFKYYYDDGDWKTISNFYSNGTRCRTKHYFPGKILMAEGNYVNGKRDSIWKFYNAPNSLVSEESFKNGKKDGFEKNFDGAGKLLEERNWKDSLLNGPWKKYYEDGSIQQEGNYLKGHLEGDMKFYYPGKVLAVSGPYLHGLKTGKWVYYNRTGKVIIQVENFKNGKYDGYYAEWYEKDGTPKVKGSYKGDKRNDKWTYFNEKGKLEKDSTFKVGYLHGMCSEYYENGTKKSESNYYYSHKAGKWTEWDETGKVTKTEDFGAVEDVKNKMAIEEKEYLKTHPQKKPETPKKKK